MSNLSQFFGGNGVKPQSITGREVTPAGTTAPVIITGVALANSGACTAATLKTVLSVSGRGALTWLGCRTANATSKTARFRITIDGTVVYDKTSSAEATTGRWNIAHGSTSGASGYPAIEGIPLMYESSLLIEYACSVTETDGVQFGYINYLR